MSDACFAYDWIVDIESIIYTGTLANFALDHHCKLNIDSIIQDNGLRVIRFIVYSTSEQNATVFLEKAKENTPFSEWFSVDQRDYPEPTQGMESWHGLIFNNFIDECYGIALDNDSILKNERK